MLGTLILWTLMILGLQIYYIHVCIMPFKRITFGDLIFIMLIPTVIGPYLVIWFMDSLYNKELYSWR